MTIEAPEGREKCIYYFLGECGFRDRNPDGGTPSHAYWADTAR